MDDMEESEYLMDVLEFVYERYNLLIEMYPRVGHELVWYILRDPCFRFDVKRVWVDDEFPTYMRYLMVPKTSYGVRVIKCMKPDVSLLYA
tara:strand:+ start:3831 stop:4100 length:270 start_codon:yes stop_codon:yes gene_type:complete